MIFVITKWLLFSVIIGNSILLIACQPISEVPANEKPGQIQQGVTTPTQSEQPNLDPTEAHAVPEETARYQAPLTYENVPFTFKNPCVLEIFQNRDYDPKSREKLTAPTFEDIREYVEKGSIVTFRFIEHGKMCIPDGLPGDFIIDAINSVPDENGDYYLGIRQVETGEVELVPVDTAGVVLANFVDNWQSYTPSEPSCTPVSE